MRRPKLWSGLTSFFAVIMVIAMIGNTLATANASYINSQLGINTAVVVEKGTAPTDTTYYKSQFGAFDDIEAQKAAIAAALEQNINEMREGAALLMNRNDVLPLASETRISVFGHGAVDPAYQASSAGTKVKNGSVNAIDLKTALENQGYVVNETLWNALANGTAARGVMKQRWGGMSIAVTGSAAGSEENAAFYRQYTDTFADYSDAAIVVFTRHADLSQLNAYVSYFRENEMNIGDNPPVGILLCTRKGDKMVEYALAGMDNDLFVSTYMLSLPDKKTLQEFLLKEIEK